MPLQVSGSGTDWKLHSKSFDEELQEGQVGGDQQALLDVSSLDS